MNAMINSMGYDRNLITKFIGATIFHAVLLGFFTPSQALPYEKICMKIHFYLQLAMKNVKDFTSLFS